MVQISCQRIDREDSAIKRQLLFKQRSLFGLRALALILLSVLLLILDLQWPSFHKLRNQLEVIILPIEKMVDLPIQLVSWVSSTVTQQEALVKDNARLRAHEFILQAKLQKLLTLERENVQLKALLRSTDYLSSKVMLANLLAVAVDSGMQQVILDKGSTDHIYVGQPVLDAYGVMGQVVDVSELSAKVLLITDKNSAIPVRDYRNGVRAVAVGNGDAGTLSLINVPDTADIKVGDLFVSSGLGLRYPVGYPVGLVTQVARSSHQDFASVILSPSAHMNRTQQVLLTWPLNAKQRQRVIDLLHKNIDSSQIKSTQVQHES